MTKQDNTSGDGFDLEERTAAFGERVIDFAKRLPVDVVTKSMIDQLIRSATSVGANYCEADDAQTKREFYQKISYCRKESREAKHWLRMIARAAPDHANDSRNLWQEAKELNLIFSAIVRTRDNDS